MPPASNESATAAATGAKAPLICAMNTSESAWVKDLEPWWLRHGAICTGGAAFLLYTLLAQRTGYGDGPGAILKIDTGAYFTHTPHWLYVPLVAATSRALACLDLSLFACGRIASAVGTAIGIALLFAAARRLTGSGRQALGIAGLTATCPAVMFFATTTEYHGPFFAFASLATYVMVRLLERPGPGNAISVGLATCLAYLVHASGHLLAVALVTMFIGMACTRRGEAQLRNSAIGWRQAIYLAWVILATHLVAVLVASYAVQSIFNPRLTVGSALDFLIQWTSRHDYSAALIGKTVWLELVWPYLPLSGILLFVSGRRIANRSVPNGGTPLAFGLAALGYLLMSIALVPGYDEHGAYATPLAWFASVLVVTSISGPPLRSQVDCTMDRHRPRSCYLPDPSIRQARSFGGICSRRASRRWRPKGLPRYRQGFSRIRHYDTAPSRGRGVRSREGRRWHRTCHACLFATIRLSHRRPPKAWHSSHLLAGKLRDALDAPRTVRRRSCDSQASPRHPLPT